MSTESDPMLFNPRAKVSHAVSEAIEIPIPPDPFARSDPLAAEPTLNLDANHVNTRWELSISPFGSLQTEEEEGADPVTSQIVQYPSNSYPSTSNAVNFLTSSNRASLSLRSAVKKISYGKLFPGGFPTTHDPEKTQHAPHIAEELSSLLEEDPSWQSPRQLQDLYRKETRTQQFAVITRAESYASAVENAKRNGKRTLKCSTKAVKYHATNVTPVNELVYGRSSENERETVRLKQKSSDELPIRLLSFTKRCIVPNGTHRSLLAEAIMDEDWVDTDEDDEGTCDNEESQSSDLRDSGEKAPVTMVPVLKYAPSSLHRGRSKDGQVPKLHRVGCVGTPYPITRKKSKAG